MIFLNSSIQVDPLPMDSAAWRTTIERASSRLSGTGADAKAVADATVFVWERIALQLAPVIGDVGIRALYARSLHLARAQFPWLSQTEKTIQTDYPFASLNPSLAARDASDAIVAAAGMFVTFTTVLITLIGASLTSRLLAPVLTARGSNASAQETNP